MDCQEQVQGGGGWPLGLQILNDRQANPRSPSPPSNGILLADSTNSMASDSSSSSDPETESTGSSFFYERSITLGSLIGIRCERRNFQRHVQEEQQELEHRRRNSSNHRALSRQRIMCSLAKPWWLFCGLTEGRRNEKKDDNNNEMPPSLGHFLRVERRASAASATNDMMYLRMLIQQEFPTSACGFTNNGGSLFTDGRVLPPNNNDASHSSSWVSAEPSVLQNQRSSMKYKMLPLVFHSICGRTAVNQRPSSQKFHCLPSSVHGRFCRCFSF